MTAQAVLQDIRTRVSRMTTPDGVNSPPDRYLTWSDRAAGDVDCIAHIAADLNRLTQAVTAVLDRHKPWSDSSPVCCIGCRMIWPCPDYRNVTDALENS